MVLNQLTRQDRIFFLSSIPLINGQSSLKLGLNFCQKKAHQQSLPYYALKLFTFSHVNFDPQKDINEYSLNWANSTNFRYDHVTHSRDQPSDLAFWTPLTGYH